MHKIAYFYSGILQTNIRCFILLCLFTISLFYPSAQSYSSTSETLVISYRPDSAPMQFINDDGQADGILIDFWKLWSDKSGINIEFKAAYNKQANKMLYSSIADFNAGVFANNERAKYMDFSDPILDSPYHFYIDRSINSTFSKAKLKQYRVGVTQGSFHENYMRTNYPDVVLTLYKGYQDLFKAADESSIQVFISQPMYRRYYLKKNSLVENFIRINPPLYTHGYRAGVKKNNKELLQTINRFIASVSNADKALITGKWLGFEWRSTVLPPSGVLDLSATEKEWLKNNPLINIGGESNWPPFDFADANGRHQGITADYLTLLEKRLGIRFVVHYKQPWTDTLNMLKTGELDAVSAISKTPQREAYANFTMPYVSYPYVIIADNKNTRFNSLISLSGKRVAVEKGFYTYNTLKLRYPDITLVIQDSTEQAILAVTRGLADAYVGVQPVASYFIEENMITNLRVTGVAALDKVGISMAVNKNNPVLIKLLEKGLDSITIDERLAIQRKWLGISIEHSKLHRPINLSDELNEWISQHKTLKMGVDPNWPPIEYINKKGIYSGIASDYVNDFESLIGVKFTYDSELKWSEVIQKIKKGEIDILPAISKTPEREKYLNFTNAYMHFPYVLFTRNDAELITGLDELVTSVIVVEKNYTNHEILKRHHPEIELLLVNDTEDALKAVALGDADAYMGNLAVTSHIILQSGITNIKVAAPTEYSNNLSFAVRKDLPELLELLQLYLDSVSVEEENQFKKKWFSINYDHKVDYSLLWKTVVGALFILLLSYIWLWFINRQKEALRISEERFRLVMQATQEGVWDWNIQTGDAYYSPGFYRMLGYAESEFSTKSRTWMKLIHPQDYEYAKHSLNKFISAHKEYYTLEFRMKHKRGNYRNILATGSIQSNDQGEAVRVLGSLTDITEKKAADNKIKQTEAQLKRIIDTIPLAIVISDNDGTIVFANRQTEKEIGSNRNVTGLSINAFYENIEDRDRMFSIYKEQGVIDSMPMRFKTLSGELTEGIISMIQVSFDGATRNLGVLVNLTERIQMERELIAAKVQADIANKTKSSFLANMSHEIRTPMNAIIGLGYLMQKTQLNDRQRDYIQKIQSSSRSLLDLINDILDFSKIEAGKLEIQNTEFNLEDIIHNLSSLFALKADEKNLEIIFLIEPDVPVHLTGDSSRIRQVLINLTQNAVKFTQSGEVQVKISKLEKQDDLTVIQFSVTDTGIGIDSDYIASLFDAFSQVDDSYNRKFEGSGLGLAISKQLVELMSGDIKVESKPGEGSVFSFRLSFAVDESLNQKDNVAVFQSQKVLVVDDNKTSREVLKVLLESVGFNVTLADTGTVAYDLLIRSADTDNTAFNLILVDWKMPELNGLQLADKICSTLKGPHIPTLLMLSAYEREEIMQKQDHSGIDGFLIKPINSTVLLNTISETLLGRALTQSRHDIRSSDKRLNGEILLVEDNSINQQVAREILENMGLFVSVACNGVEALSAMQEHNYDLILTDIQMPEMDGFELTHNIRKHEKFKNIPVIAMTAHAMVKDREECINAGMNDHIAKPIDPDNLFNTLSYWIKSVYSTEGHSQQPANSLRLPDQLPGIDIDWALKQIGGNRQLLAKLLKEFYEDYADSSLNIKNAIAADDLQLAKRLIHTIKGISASIGAKILMSSAIELENVVHNKLILESSIWNDFYTSLNDVISGIKKWADSYVDSSIKDLNHDTVLDKCLFDEINLLIRQGSSEAEKIIKSINTGDLEADALLLLNRLLESVKNYDFNYAQSLLEKLENQQLKPGD